MKHTLSNIRPEFRIADCLICGPDITVNLIHRAGMSRKNDHYGCRNRVNEVKRESAKRTYSPEKQRIKNLKAHGMTPQQFDSMLEKQGGKCAVCQRTEPNGRGNWHIDHDHSCCAKAHSCGNCIRGILCSDCNTALGLMHDNIEILKSAIAYLRG